MSTYIRSYFVTRHTQAIYDGTPSYTNPLPALFLLCLMTFLCPAILTKTVKLAMTRTIIAATVGTYSVKHESTLLN